MRRLHAAATAAVLLLLWLAVLTVAFHGCGRLGCGGQLTVKKRTSSVAAPRKMLLAVTTFDATSPTDHHHHHHQHQHHHHHRHHQHRHHHVDRWNRHGIPPSAAAGNGEEIDPRYGVQKRFVPTGPNPLHH